MVRGALVAFAFALVSCAAGAPSRTSRVVAPRVEREVLVILPEPVREDTETREAEPPARGLPSPEPVDQIDTRCTTIAANVDARAAWMNPTLLRLELGPPPDGATYSDREPTNLVGARLLGRVSTKESNVLFLDLNALRVGVLANVPLECNGTTKRIRVMVMPNSGKLQFGNEFHLVKRDVP